MVKKYSFEPDHEDVYVLVQQATGGDWVETTDYEKLEAQLDASKVKLTLAQSAITGDKLELVEKIAELAAQLARVCEWHEVSCYDELPFVVDEMRECQISVRQEKDYD